MLTKSVLLCMLIGYTVAFRCYTCNNRPEEDDAEPCEDREEECPLGVTSCSTVVFRSRGDARLHTRKFCTSAGTPIYQYLLFFPGSALCQNIETVNMPPVPPAPVVRMPSSRDGVSIDVMPPAPPNEQTSNVLCVCTKENCNKGTFRQVLEDTLMQNMVEDGPKKPANDVNDNVFKN